MDISRLGWICKLKGVQKKAANERVRKWFGRPKQGEHRALERAVSRPGWKGILNPWLLGFWYLASISILEQIFIIHCTHYLFSLIFFFNAWFKNKASLFKFYNFEPYSMFITYTSAWTLNAYMYCVWPFIRKWLNEYGNYISVLPFDLPVK